MSSLENAAFAFETRAGSESTSAVLHAFVNETIGEKPSIPKTPAFDVANQESGSYFVDFPSIVELLNDPELALRRTEALRIAPTADSIKPILTQDLVDELDQYGLNSTPASIRAGFIEAIANDYSLEELKGLKAGTFRTLAAFIAMGAISTEQGEEILGLQAQRRAEYYKRHLDTPWSAISKMFRTGDLLREKYGPIIDVADKVITPLQPPRK